MEDDNILYGPGGNNLIGWKETSIPRALYGFVCWLAVKNGLNNFYYDDEECPIKVSENYSEKEREMQVDLN